MKLLRFKINDDFRGIRKGFEMTFFDPRSTKDPSEFSPYCLVGLNGSGKSNVLEALANALFHTECIYLNYKPRGFEVTKRSVRGFDSRICSPDAFELEYFISVTWNKAENDYDEVDSWAKSGYARILISKIINERPRLEILNHEDFVNVGRIPDRIVAKEILPDLVVGYSSGENEVLSLPFFKMRFIHYDEYTDILTRRYDYKRPEGRMVYVDNQYSQSILLSNFLLQEKQALKPFTDHNDGIGILGVEQFRFIIQKNVFQRYKPEVIETFTPEDQANKSSLSIELTTLIRLSIDKLIRCSTIYRETAQDLILDYWVDENLKKAFRDEFISPLDLFRTLQILHTLNLYDVSAQVKNDIYNSSSLYVNETVPILPSHKRVFRIKEFFIFKRDSRKSILTKSLSDGEHQFLHTMGICLLLRESNALFLLDEPETHFNPDWRAKFVSKLKSCLKEDKSILRDILITSHSPFIISDCKADNVKWFVKGKKDGTKKVTLNTYGTSIIKLMNEFFGKKNQIADLALKEMLEDSKSEDIIALNDSLSKFGESSEKNMILEKINRIFIDKNISE